jgi:lipopolysaccharide transport system permease protein
MMRTNRLPRPLASGRVTETEIELREAASPDVPQLADDAARVGRVFTIRPAPRWPHLDFGELFHYRELLLTFVWRDLKVRYKQTFLGVAWALLVPIFAATIPILVLGRFGVFPSGNQPYPMLVLSGIVVSQYFTSALVGASSSVVGSVNLVTKVYFPRVLLPLAGVLVPLADFLLALVVQAALMAWYGIWPSGPQLVLAPFFLALALVTALGIGFGLATLNVRYRDVPYAIPVFLQLLPWVSGVYLELRQIPEKWQWVFSLNPVTAVVSGWRWTVLDGPAPEPAQVALGVAVAVVLVLAGLTYFRTSEPRFADTI